MESNFNSESEATSISQPLAKKVEEEIKEVLIRKSEKRWLALFLMCSLTLGYNYSMYFPSALENQILQANGNNAAEVGLFTSLYSFPNIVLPLIGGIVVDRVGVSKCLILFSGILFLGTTVSTVGGYMIGPESNRLPFNDQSGIAVMLTGRVIFALGDVIVSQWFIGPDLAFAFGILMASGMTFATITTIIMTALTESFDQNMGPPILSAALLCFYSFVSAYVLFILDKKAEAQERRLGVFKKPAVEKFAFSDFKQLSITFWIINIDDVLLVASSMGFTQFFMNFYTTIYQISQLQAGEIQLVGIVSIPLIIISGKIIDKVGKRALVLLFSCLIQLLSYALYLYVPSCPTNCQNQAFSVLIPIMILGAIASSMINISLFPSIPLCCEQKLLGTAFGLLDGFQQLGGVIIPIFASMIIEATGGIGATNYIGFLYFFFAIAIINTAISLLLYMYDLRHDAILDKVYKEGDKKSMRRSTVFKQSLIM